ncbi:CPBP family intramembrane metalloprotease [Enterococcus sp. 669A]|uniref:CPBP family intramembrane metalloprotease n=1 Tax=Candidatus Enterococcus moelleringii TaxID=2815325 RepID=A0ABS3LEI1_9ENTE|nr:CPBP family glutamic-type intramembrane protease [Enterococcus sp. 669A]MBO1308046.1 CPBP family intramembrane metalloprotease [Enterococcus sp. 669A]
MFERIENTKPKTWGLILTPFLLIIGFAGRINNWPLSWLWLFAFSSIALIAQFGLGSYQIFLQPMKKGKWKSILGLTVLSFVLSFAASRVGILLFNNASNANPIAKVIVDNSLWENIYFFLTTWISLAGEELITAAVAFPLYHFLTKRFTSNKAFLLSSIFAALFFGSLHLSTYSWNWYQCLVIIGLTRIPFNYVWKRTDSLRGGIIAHTLYDYTLFLIMLIVALLQH